MSLLTMAASGFDRLAGFMHGSSHKASGFFLKVLQSNDKDLFVAKKGECVEGWEGFFPVKDFRIKTVSALDSIRDDSSEECHQMAVIMLPAASKLSSQIIQHPTTDKLNFILAQPDNKAPQPGPGVQFALLGSTIISSEFSADGHIVCITYETCQRAQMSYDDKGKAAGTVAGEVGADPKGKKGRKSFSAGSGGKKKK